MFEMYGWSGDGTLPGLAAMTENVTGAWSRNAPAPVLGEWVELQGRCW